MSDLNRLTLVTSAGELADFPTHYETGEADQLLAGWTALWHPVLLAAAQSIPTLRADYDLPDPSHLEGELAIVPEMFDHGDVSTWREQLQQHPDRRLYAVQGLGDREKLIAAAFTALGKPTDSLDPDLAADFYALGYAFLQVEMLTRLMRYSHLIEADKLRSTVIGAAQAALDGRAEQARESIAAACDMLSQAKNHYYPVDVYFVDVALLAESVWGAPLRDELAGGESLNVLATGQQLEQLSASEPESIAALRASLSAKPATACLIGGAYSSGAISQHSPEAMLADFVRGRQAALDTLGIVPRVHGHFDAGAAPLLPRLLSDFGIQGALLAGFNGGPMPRADQCRTTWSGPDGASIEALVTAPHDAGKSATFLRLAEAISNAMDHDHVATILLAGWPGHRSSYLNDLRRIARFGSILGRFITLEEYFETTVASDYGFTTRLDDFGARDANEDTVRAEITATHDQLLSGLAQIAATSVNFDSHAPVSLLQSPKSSTESIAHALGVESTNSNSLLAVNAWNFDRTIAQESTTIPHVPGFGFSIGERTATKSPVPLVEGLRLRNEYLEVLLDEKTGGIQSVHFHGKRGNHFSQQLVYRENYRHPDEFASDLQKNLVDRSQMEVREFQPLDSTHEAAVTSVGRLVTPENVSVANFRQTIRLPRSTRLVRIEVELTPESHLNELTPAGYFASRLAWRDSEPAIARSVQWLNLLTFRRSFTSIPWTRVDTSTPLTLIASGTTEFQRIGERMLDTVFPIGMGGIESASYSIDVAVGESFPAAAALGRLTVDKSAITSILGAPASPKGWWIHLAAENLVATHLSLAPEEPRSIELRALETMGLSTHTLLRMWCPIVEAHRVNLTGEAQEPLRIAEGCVELEIAPYEWFGVRCQI